ncbi:MAG: O-antigen ligase family protein, partial [Geminicoccaceae bacterium]
AGGLVVGSTIHLLVHNPWSAIGWKFGFAGPTTTLLLMCFTLVPVLRSPSSLVGPMIMVALGAFSAFMDFRSWGGVLMLSAAFLSVPAVLRLFGLRPKPLSYGRMFIVGCLLLATGYGALKVYGSAAQSGLLGERSKDKYETQSALGDIGILLGGRSESLVTVQAIMDSPLIGHGSWAKDRYYAELKQLMLYKLGFTNRFIPPENDLIPTHSHLLGAWVEAGLGGVLFWFGILMMIMASLRRLYASDDPIRPYLAFLMFLFIWDILFSPFGAQRRLTNGFLLVAMLYVLQASALGWRRRVAEAAPEPVYESWAAAAMRPHDHWAAFGLSDPRPSRWQEQSSEPSEPVSSDDPETDDDGSETPESPIAPDPITSDIDDPDIDEGAPDSGDDAPDLDDDAPESPELDTDKGEGGGIDEQLDLADPDPADDGPKDEVEEVKEEEGESEVLRGRRPTDLGAGGETIRAGFRRLRQRNR